MTLLPQQSDCAGCDLRDGARNVGIRWLRLSEAGETAVLFLGMNPGVTEDKHGLPFIDMSGVYLRGGFITRSGQITLNQNAGSWHPGGYITPSLLASSSIYIGNIVRCVTPGNSNPRAKSVKGCLPYLRRDLSFILSSAPRSAVVLLGAWAIKQFFHYILGEKNKTLAAVLRENGSMHTIDERPTAVFGTYHPAALLPGRNPNAIPAVEAHMRLVRRFIDGSPSPKAHPNLIPPAPPR